jgi:hypothetical protein
MEQFQISSRSEISTTLHKITNNSLRLSQILAKRAQTNYLAYLDKHEK